MQHASQRLVGAVVRLRGPGVAAKRCVPAFAVHAACPEHNMFSSTSAALDLLAPFRIFGSMGYMVTH